MQIFDKSRNIFEWKTFSGIEELNFFWNKKPKKAAKMKCAQIDQKPIIFERLEASHQLPDSLV